MSAASGVPGRPVSPTVLDKLLREPHAFGLGEAIGVLGKLTGVAEPLGTGHLDAAIRVRCARSFSGGGPVVERVVPAPDNTWDLYTAAFNLAGAGGTLPDSLDRMIFDPAGCDAVVLEQLDRLTHRAVAAWYRMWARHPAGEAKAATPLAVEALFRRPRTAAKLARLIEWFTGAPAQVLPCRGDWRRVPSGEEGLDQLTFTRLNRCRLKIGPLDRLGFRALRSENPLFRSLLQRADEFCDGKIGFEVELTVRGRDLPDVRWDRPGAWYDESCLPAQDLKGLCVAVIGADRCDRLLHKGA